jgi:peptidase M48-like protein
MDVTLFIPLAASAVVAGLSRVATPRLWPRAAAWATAVSGTVLALSTVGALVLLACPLPAQLPLVATLGRWQPRVVSTYTPTPAAVSALALAILVVLAARIFMEARALVREVGGAAQLRASVAVGRAGVVVIDDPVPAAHAVVGGFSRRGVVVVTTGMLTELDDDERSAVIAHERSHLRRHHAVFTGVMRLAAAIDPLLVGMRGDMGFVLERWADEDAAGHHDRAVVASALAKSALRSLASARRTVTVPGLALQRHGVPARVAALLTAPRRRTRAAWVFVAIGVAAVVALVSAMHDTERFFEAARALSRRP